ncbi:MAG: glycerophosphodiester phosphodiesterase family protein [Bacilli bacterium]
MKKSKFISALNPLFLKGIAHRGLHDEVLTENGLPAFIAAINAGFAIELDVHLTLDQKLVVFHDFELTRTTGKAGIIEELTLAQLKNGYQLLDGSSIPTFKEVLETVKEIIPIVVELKVYKKNYKNLSKCLKEELKSIKDKKNFMLISFDPRALFPFAFSGFMRSLLVGKANEWTYSLRHFFPSLDVEHVLLEEKRVQKYQKKHFVNCWTVESKEVLEKVLPFTDTVTFQHLEEGYIKNKLNIKRSK